MISSQFKKALVEQVHLLSDALNYDKYDIVPT